MMRTISLMGTLLTRTGRGGTRRGLVQMASQKRMKTWGLVNQTL